MLNDLASRLPLLYASNLLSSQVNTTSSTQRLLDITVDSELTTRVHVSNGSENELRKRGVLGSITASHQAVRETINFGYREE
jgi:hypothetical protein